MKSSDRSTRSVSANKNVNCREVLRRHSLGQLFSCPLLYSFSFAGFRTQRLVYIPLVLRSPTFVIPLPFGLKTLKFFYNIALMVLLQSSPAELRLFIGDHLNLCDLFDFGLTCKDNRIDFELILQKKRCGEPCRVVSFDPRNQDAHAVFQEFLGEPFWDLLKR